MFLFYNFIQLHKSHQKQKLAKQKNLKNHEKEKKRRKKTLKTSVKLTSPCYIEVFVEKEKKKGSLYET